MMLIIHYHTHRMAKAALLACKHQLAKVFIKLSMSKFMCFLAIWLVTISSGNGALYFQHFRSYPRHVEPFIQPPQVNTFEMKGFHHACIFHSFHRRTWLLKTSRWNSSSIFGRMPTNCWDWWILHLCLVAMDLKYASRMNAYQFGSFEMWKF